MPLLDKRERNSRVHFECATNSVRLLGPRRFSPRSPSIAFTLSNAGTRDLHLLRISLGAGSDWNILWGSGGFSGVDGIEYGGRALHSSGYEKYSLTLRLSACRMAPHFAVVGIIIYVALLSRLSIREALLMGVTALLAAGNWWWSRRTARINSHAQKVVEVAGIGSAVFADVPGG